jgi:hypothetical protein
VCAKIKKNSGPKRLTIWISNNIFVAKSICEGCGDTTKKPLKNTDLQAFIASPIRLAEKTPTLMIKVAGSYETSVSYRAFSHRRL